MTTGTQYGPVLTGMRGSGKSTLAPMVAERLGLGSIDADRELERRVGRPVAEIFARSGEAAFRREERALLLDDLLRRPRTVVATGGGAVLDKQVRRILKARFTVWLRVPVEILAERVRGSDRPSLTGAPIEVELRELMAQRGALYQEVAALIVDAVDGESAQAVDAIAKGWHRANSP